MKAFSFQLFFFCCSNFFSSALIANSVEYELSRIDKYIASEPDNINHRLKKARLLFETNQHQLSIDEYNIILKLKPKEYRAYFGRGMALGRLGQIQKGIDDISVFIKHHSENSLAYTKRGVRYLWLGELQKASDDFHRAISIDPKNAEAHDDLGVILAQQNKPKEAAEHFLTTIKYGPSYQKTYHNLALTYFIYDNSVAALSMVNKAIALPPNSKDTVLLKSEILRSLGNIRQSDALKEDAQFLPKATGLNLWPSNNRTKS